MEKATQSSHWTEILKPRLTSSGGLTCRRCTISWPQPIKPKKMTDGAQENDGNS